jgi:hypothetical protein
MRVKTVNIFLMRVIIKNTRLSVNNFFSYYLLPQTGALVGVIYLMLNVQSEYLLKINMRVGPKPYILNKIVNT